MTTADIFLFIIIVLSLVGGFFWGAVRSLLLVVAWLAAFLAGAYLAVQVGSWLAQQWTNFLPAFNQMAGFLLVYMGILLSAPVIIYLGRRGQQGLTKMPVLDDIAASVLAGFVALLAISGLMIVLSTYYEIPGASVEGGPAWTADLYHALTSSQIGQRLDDTLVPLIITVLGPILPSSLREFLDLTA